MTYLVVASSADSDLRIATVLSTHQTVTDAYTERDLIEGCAHSAPCLGGFWVVDETRQPVDRPVAPTVSAR